MNGTHVFTTADSAKYLRNLPDRYADLVFTSPPYEDARTYEIGGGPAFKLAGQAWVDWLSAIIVECARVSSGLVLVNMSARVVNSRYSSAVEWLVADLTRVHGLVCGPSPYAWTKNGTPGSGRNQYHRRDWEPVYSFALPDRLPLKWADPLAGGRKPKFHAGGLSTSRRKNGVRANRTKPYIPPEIANPGNVVHCTVGGGRLGTSRAHKCEAPMPQALAEKFVRWYCPPGGLVLDPFCGSGTTVHAAVECGRRGHGIDVRPVMTLLSAERLLFAQPPLPFGSPSTEAAHV